MQEEVLYLEGKIGLGSDLNVSIESYITVFALAYCGSCQLKIHFIDLNNSLTFVLPESALKKIPAKFLSEDEIPVLLCCPPFISLDDNTYIGGLCSVLRYTIKSLSKNERYHPLQELLGFRGGCLSACAESSIWTKFCELEMTAAAKKMSDSLLSEDICSSIPESLEKLEMHLKRPVKTHNILKRKLDFLKNSTQSTSHNQNEEVGSVLIKESVNTLCAEFNRMKLSKDLELDHCFLEGIDLTLADIIVLPCAHFLLEVLQAHIAHVLPLVTKWYNSMLSITSVKQIAILCAWNKLVFPANCCSKDHCDIFSQLKFSEGSLYSRDSCHTKVKCRNFDPSVIINLLEESSVRPIYEKCDFEKLKWDQLPDALHPSQGDLPKRRIERKAHQLESIVCAVIDFVKPSSETVVDFCSGGGHVGLLLAYCLPECQIYLVENKEESMLRARKRAVTLGLKNIKFFQCNMGYFKGDFDIGVALHACGIATDTVIKKCISQGASFVCCPCCYGRMQETDELTYPLSKKFQSVKISYQEFQLLAHCADRTEVNTERVDQGIYSMGLIDTDRKLYAAEHGYKTVLTTLQPVTCSTKHNLLIGVRS